MGYGAGHYVIKVSFIQAMGGTKDGWDMGLDTMWLKWVSYR